MQYQYGTVSWTGATNRFISDTTQADWSSVIPAESYFVLATGHLPYQIANVYSPTDAGNSGSGRWEATVVGIIFEGTGTGQAYGIQTDWNTAGLPILVDGDYQIPELLTLAFNKIALLAISTPQVQSYEEGSQAITSGATSVIVNFAAAKTNSSYVIEGSIENTSADATKNVITFSPTVKTTTSFTVKLAGTVNTANYVLKWKVGSPPDKAGNQILFADVSVAGADAASLLISSSIPQTCTHLLLRSRARTDHSGVQTIMGNMNNDANTANYINRQIWNASTSAVVTQAAGGSMGVNVANPVTGPDAGDWGMGDLIIPFYRDSVYKRGMFTASYWFGGPLTISIMGSGVWLNTAAISRIDVLPIVAGTKLKIGSRFMLYGIF